MFTDSGVGIHVAPDPGSPCVGQGQQGDRFNDDTSTTSDFSVSCPNGRGSTNLWLHGTHEPTGTVGWVSDCYLVWNG